MNEIWKPVKDFETYYEISNLGNVRNIKTNKVRKPQVHEDGYLCLLLCVNRIRYTKYIHRLIAEAFISNPLNLPEVNHIDGNKKNNSIENLEWCTHIENVAHANKTGLVNSFTQVRGIKCSYAKLNNEQVYDIRKQKNIVRQVDLAKLYCVNKKTIYNIQNNKSWKHLL